jgi:multidrug resistance efflux pump
MLRTLINIFFSLFPWLALLLILTAVYRPDLFFKIDSAKSGFIAKPVASVPISVGKIVSRTLAKSLKTTGSFKGLETIAVIPKVEGRVCKVFHDIGDEVYPGEPLLLIDETDLKLVVNEAKKSLELEMAKAAERLGNAREDVGKLQKKIDQARKELLQLVDQRDKDATKLAEIKIKQKITKF